MYDNDPKGKKIFHCDKCKCCMQGGRDTTFHCDVCDICLPLAVKDDHNCGKLYVRNNCPICLDEIIG